MELTVTETEADFVDVDVVVKNATVWGIQAAFRYAPEVLQPVNSKGEPLPVNVIVNYEGEKTEEVVETHVVKPKVEINKDNRKNDIICLVVGKPTTITFGKKVQIDEQNKNVVP